MTSKEIVKLLRRGMFSNILLQMAADTIETLESEKNRLQDEKQNLEVELKSMRGAANSYKAENERLKVVKKHIDTVIHRDCEYPSAETYNKAFQKALEQLYDSANAKAEAYKECIEKVKEIMHKYCGDITEDDLDDLLKELVGEDNETQKP